MRWIATFLLTVVCATPAAARGVYVAEVLADPPPGAAGDANGDGVRDPFADEFVEIVNGGDQPVDLEGWRLGDDDGGPGSWFVFPPLTLQPEECVVVFGGGSPRGIPSPAFADDGRIGDGLANEGDVIVLITAAGDTADLVAGTGWGRDRSHVRPGPGTSLVPYGDPAGDGSRFSPGRLTPVPRPPPPAARARPVRIVEILADPAAGDGGDANGDGRRNAYADEFVEIWNPGPDTVDIGGWRLGDDDGAGGFRFPAGSALPPDGRAVVFGGGRPREALTNAFAAGGRIGNGLANGGDAVLLRNAAGDTVDAVSGSGWPADRSVIRFPEDCDPPACRWLPHDDPAVSRRRFSPGSPARDGPGEGD